MANAMIKRGNEDNIVTYQHVCDTNGDMNNIPNDQITLGSTCIVLKGTAGGVEMYMAGSDKKWVSLMTSNSSSEDEGGEG